MTSKAISSDSLQLAMVEEASPGVTPATPTFEVWRTTGESLGFDPETTENAEIGGSGRSAIPDNITGYTVTGDINFLLSKFTAIEMAMEGTLASGWGLCPLTGAAGGALEPGRVTVGRTTKTYTIEKRFPNPNYVAGGTSITCVPTGAPGTTVTLTFGGTTVGSGVVVFTIVMSDGAVITLAVQYAAGATAQEVATASAAVLDSYGALIAVDNADLTVTLTDTAGIGFTSVTPAVDEGQYLYQRFRGVSFSQFTLDIAPNADITGSASVVSGQPTLDWIPISGVTYNAPGKSPVFTAPEVLELELGGGYSLQSHCWTSLTLTLDSQNEGLACIGVKGESGVRLGKFMASLTGEVYFLDQVLLNMVLTNQVLGNGHLAVKNANNDTYRFDLFQLKPVDADASAGATNETVTMPVELHAGPVKVCDDGVDDWTASVIISQANTAPTLP